MIRVIKLIFSFCALFFAKNVYSQEWIPIDMPAPPKSSISIEVTESDQFTYKAKFHIHGIYDQEIFYRGAKYHYLSFGNGGQLNEIGKPSLPTITQFIAIPPGAKASATLTHEKWSKIDMGKIYPARETQNIMDTISNLYIDERSYTDFFLPTKLEEGEEMMWGNNRCRNIVICPFEYYPLDNSLSVLTEFTLQVDFYYENEQNKNSELYETDDYMKLFANKIFVSDSMLSTARNDESYDYLIIVGNGLNNIIQSDKMIEFRIWKALKGFKTKVVTTTETETNATLIKRFIGNEKKHYGIKYVLLVGDADRITPGDTVSSNNTTINSDYWYGCFSNNNAIADIPVGRFPVSSQNSLSDFENMVDKTIKYEWKYCATNQTLLVAHYDYAPQNYQHCCEQIRGASYNEGMSFIKAYGAPSGTDYQGTNARNDTVIKYINDGVHIINYRGHGGENYWGNPSWNVFSESFADSLINSMNNETCALFFSIACKTGSFINQTCMLETFLRSRKGASVFIGSTYSNETGCNDTYNIALFNKLLNDGIYKIGNLNISAHSQSIISNNFNSTNKDVAYSYILGGDPTLEIWTDIPQTIGNVDLTTSNNTITLNTNISGNYYVSISSVDGEFIQTLSPSGNTCSFNIPANKFYISIYKHNYFPKVIYYDSETQDIVNMRYDYDAYYTATPIDIHTEATGNDEDEGTIVRSGNKLVIKKGSGGVTINDGFECEIGAEFVVE